MESAEWHETVFVIGKRTNAGTFDNENCKVFDKNGYCWIVEQEFYKRLELPEDPCKWDQVQVLTWMKWAKNEYNLTNLNITKLTINGKQLTSDNFSWNIAGLENKSLNDDFWTHICLLKTMHKIYIKQNDEECIDICVILNYKNKMYLNSDFNHGVEIWQFLLNLLTDSGYQNVIEWVNNEGTFKIIKPNTISIMWGLVKNNWKMNYNKMAAALRYHYGKGIIERAKGKHVYKFAGDIKTMIGYNPMDMKNMFQQESN
ncbi:protein c-ets-2-B-like [Rhopalosiphum padi]|uniref:protein c-ets-2-B-like n=1 Tax=Rhopalosiphum padi TaxID=40932 RepID=UPI00298E1A17|nr:protein c-ets-2-B-like [Rhopalosiphum padi]XP_060842497.1 protein c-ets-2-B-like [Rhopalosiphum padi]XP_060842498.1 protein c-ets-2-B-like [Rhopalosiphum padi]XP_060842500.1 protein c-ets-2-B-like [Rhopalosiphum padi]